MQYRSDPDYPGHCLTSQLFPGKDEFACLCREKDWSQTPLGPVDSWPTSLRTAAALVFASPLPMVLLWGEELAQIYNDGYRKVMGRKHPAGLGQPARECWPEVWEFNALLYDGVINRRETFTFQDQRLEVERHGHTEQSFFTLAYSPVMDDQCAVGGVLVTFAETPAVVTQKAQTMANETEERLRVALEAAELGTWDLDLTTDTSAVRSLRHDQIFGYEEHQAGWGQEIATRHVLPEDRPIIQQAFARAAETGVLSCEVRVRWPDDSIHWIAPLGRTYYDGEGRPVRMAGVVADITERNQAEALRQSEERFRLMADSVPQIVWVTDPEGQVEFFNQQWSNYTGLAYQPETAAAMAAAVIHPDDVALTMGRFEQARRDGTVVQVEHRMRSAAGDYRWFLVKVEPYRDPRNGLISRWFGASVDIHDRKLAEAALRRSETRYRSLFESIDQGFCVIEIKFDQNDRPYDYVFCELNASFQTQTGLVDAVGKSMRELTPEHESHWFDIYGRVASIGEPVRFKSEAKALHRWYDVFAFRIEEEDGPRVAILFNDITEQKHMTETLHRSEHAAIKAAHQADSERQKLDALLQAVPVGIVGLVDDLLDVSRVTSGLVKLDKVVLDAKKILSDAVEQVRPLIEMRRHRLAVYTPPEAAFVCGDVKRLVQVMANLLNNAAKYTPEGGEIVLGVEVAGSYVKLDVSDNGIGIAPEVQPTVFDLFTQAARTSDRSQGGLGIGLALVKSLVELHGGHITVHSNGIGKGSRFVVCLPHMDVDIASPNAERQMTALSPPGKVLKVLVVDDNADAAQMLGMVIEELGHEVFVEYHPERAIERARAAAPDVCLLDIGLPDMDGNEIARRLRQRPETAKSTLIAVTGYGQDQDRDMALSAGFDHHFAKPIDSAKLAGLLSDIAGNSGMPE